MGFKSLIISISGIALGFRPAFAQEQQQPFLRRPKANESQDSIEAREVEPGLFSISVPPTADYSDSRRRKLRSSEKFSSCTLLLEDVFYTVEDPRNVEEIWVCTFEDYTNHDGGDPSRYTVKFAEDVEIVEHLHQVGAVSGSHALRWELAEAVSLNEKDDTLKLNAPISEDGNILWIEAIKQKPVSEEDEISERKLQFMPPVMTRGEKNTLVIRVVGDGVAPKISLSEIREEVFTNDICLKSQMEKCSHGALKIKPHSGRTQGLFGQKISGGVVELGISTNPKGMNDKRFENDAVGAAYYVFGPLESQFDLLIFVMPPGIKPKFAAYAYIGTPFSFFSDGNIRDTMIQMHEIGHNLGLQHAGEDGEEYGDASGYMGYSETSEPSMCYNAVNSYQLGWYSNLSIKPLLIDAKGYTFYISGVAGYDPEETTKYVSLRLVQETTYIDYYIGYNRADGINAETQEDADKVIVFIKEGDVHETKTSWKIATLNVDESCVIENFDNSGRSVRITFSDIDSDVAVVEITPESSESPSLSPTASPNSEATTKPTAKDSIAPTIGETATTTFWTTTATTSATTFSGTAPGSTAGTTNVTAPATRCNDELFLNITIQTDYFPEETWWTLKMIGGEQIGQVFPSGYDAEFTYYAHSFCLVHDSCYLFKIHDTAEDGMGFVGETTASPGYYKVYLDHELKFGKEGDWGKIKSHKLCTPPVPLIASSNETAFDLAFEDDLLLGNETDNIFDYSD